MGRVRRRTFAEANGGPAARGRGVTGLVLRLAEAADLPAIREVTLEAYDIYEPLLGFMPLPVTTDYAPHVAAGGVWMGELASHPVPVAVLVTQCGDGHLLIYSLAVRPDWQGEGHARAMVEHACGHARAAGLAEVRLFTNALMARNISLYRHCGFREVGRRAHPTRAGSEVVDMVRGV